MNARLAKAARNQVWLIEDCMRPPRVKAWFKLPRSELWISFLSTFRDYNSSRGRPSQVPPFDDQRETTACCNPKWFMMTQRL